MKKLFALVCLFNLLLAAPAFAADPFDVHEGGFGPKIKGLQLGMPMTLRQMRQTMRETFPFCKFAIRIFNIKGLSKNENDIILQYSKNEDGENAYSLIDYGAHKSFERYNKDDDIFDEIEKRGYIYMDAIDGEVTDYYHYHSSMVKIDIRHNRVIGFTIRAWVFGAGSMSFEEFAQSMRNAYPLPPLEKNSDGDYEGFNRSEGWKVLIRYDEGDYISISPTDIPELD